MDRAYFWSTKWRKNETHVTDDWDRHILKLTTQFKHLKVEHLLFINFLKLSFAAQKAVSKMSIIKYLLNTYFIQSIFCLKTTKYKMTNFPRSKNKHLRTSKSTIGQNTKWLPLEIKSLRKESFYYSFPRSNKWHHVHDIIKATLRFWSHSRRTIWTFGKDTKKWKAYSKIFTIFY